MKLFDWLNDDETEPPSSPLLAKKLTALNDIPVNQVMVPRALITGLDADVQLRRVRRLKSLKVSHLPVYRGDLDHVIGWIAKSRVLELLNLPTDETDLKDHLEPIGFVGEDQPASVLADLFLRARAPLLVVRNASDQTTGLVTLADFVNLVFGFHLAESTSVVPATAREYEL